MLLNEVKRVNHTGVSFPGGLKGRLQKRQKKYFLGNPRKGPETPEKAEELASKYCDRDTNGCLTWEEVEDCVDNFHEYLEEFGIPPPTKEMFSAMAHVENGVPCLSFEDWKNSQD